jgi:hypothetical protein
MYLMRFPRIWRKRRGSPFTIRSISSEQGEKMIVGQPTTKHEVGQELRLTRVVSPPQPDKETMVGQTRTTYKADHGGRCPFLYIKLSNQGNNSVAGSNHR